MSEMRVRRRDRRGWYLVIAVFVGVALFTFLHNSARNDEVTVEAASLADFDPGYIISDYQMGRYDAMSEAEIQAFLTSKNACKNTNYNQYLSLSANSAAKWHFENGHFVCLSEELFGDGEVIGSGETAAHIIWQAAQDYKINPQALLVLLQKETSLITDTIPNNYDYRKATGYGCPDTAPCSAEYYGFKNQVRKAAALFRQVLDGGWTNYPLGNNYVQYNPAAACGGSVVNIRSLATSALYRYTPYQPNAAAITAGYGYGDTCSAYGNRNFYLYFEDWFGGAKEEKDTTKTNVDQITEVEVSVVDGDYEIISALTDNMAIDISGGAATANDGTNIQLYERNGTDAQKWNISKNTDGTYSIINPTTGKALDVWGGKSVSGTNVQLFSYNGTCAQRWQIEKESSGRYVIRSSCSLLALDIEGEAYENGANIQILDVDDERAQAWLIKRK